MAAQNIPHNHDPESLLRGITCFALDLDGTVYLGESWIDGAREFLQAVVASGRRYIFMTNNSSKSTNAYVDKLSRMGLTIPDEKIITSGQATIRYLLREYKGKSVYLMGNSSLAHEFLEAGIKLEDTHPEVVVTAFDTSLTYKKLCQVCDLIREGLPFIATHPDLNCPTETGYMPDVGSFHALIEASTGRLPDIVVGKPNREIIDAMLEKADATAAKTAVIGDRLYTDVASGIQNGLKGILVLSGESTMTTLQESTIKPNIVFDSVENIIPFL